MKARIIDKKTLVSLSPSQIMAYLRSKGAKKIEDIQAKAFIMELNNEEFLVPSSTRFADYASRLSDILSQLEIMEDRSQLLILTDLQNISFDIIRVRNVSEDSEQGSLNLLHSVDFVSKTKDMIFAAACSAVSHKISYPGKKPQNAENFMESVRFGQTVQGSFILQILSPVTPDLYGQQTLLDLPEELPYEKSVIPTLQSGLEALNQAALRTSEDDRLDHFMDAAPSGVTTNLCDAVTGMYESLKPKHIDVEISYSPNRKKTPKNASISVDSWYIPIIKEASSLIKEAQADAEPESGQIVRGAIVRLASEHPSESGLITIRDFMTPTPRMLVVELAGDDYKKAAKAHTENRFVELVGTIIKSRPASRLIANTPLKFIEIPKS